MKRQRLGIVGRKSLKLIIHSFDDDYILAVRAVKRLLQLNVESLIVAFEDAKDFYVVRNKSGTITVRPVEHTK